MSLMRCQQNGEGLWCRPVRTAVVLLFAVPFLENNCFCFKCFNHFHLLLSGLLFSGNLCQLYTIFNPVVAPSDLSSTSDHSAWLLCFYSAEMLQDDGDEREKDYR